MSFRQLTIIKYFLMDLQPERDQQTELRILMMQNQKQYEKRAQALLNRVQALLRDPNQIDVLENIHLQQALNYISETANKQREIPTNVVFEEEEIDKEILIEIQKQNTIILEQIQLLTNQMNEMSSTKAKYELAQKETMNKILELEEKVLKYNLNLDVELKNIKGPYSSPCLYYAYDELADGSIEFKQSFKHILNHHCRRLSDNQAIIQKLQRSIRQTVRQCEQQKLKLQQFQARRKQWHNTQNNISQLKKKLKQSKDELQRCVQQKEREIQQKLPQQFDRNIKQLSIRNQAYERAYLEILQIVKRGIHNADIDKVTDYIQQP